MNGVSVVMRTRNNRTGYTYRDGGYVTVQPVEPAPAVPDWNEGDDWVRPIMETMEVFEPVPRGTEHARGVGEAMASMIFDAPQRNRDERVSPVERSRPCFYCRESYDYCHCTPATMREWRETVG